jgi:hypothetical protein
MTRRTYGLLQIAQRHPQMFSAMHRKAEDLSDVLDGNDGFPRANDAMRFAMDCDEAVARLKILRGEPYLWPQVPWRTETPHRRRDEPHPSRFGDLA